MFLNSDLQYNIFIIQHKMIYMDLIDLINQIKLIRIFYLMIDNFVFNFKI